MVRNQGTLVELLGKRGIDSTQATVSRDVKRLGLIKRPARRGGYRYASPSELVTGVSEQRTRRQLKSACEQFVTKIDTGESLLVLKTLSGRANAVAVALDECGFSEVVGSLAGDDTIVVVARSEKDRAKLIALVEEMVR